MRALIISDIHGNLDALNSVLEDAKNKYDILISLGDLVGYGPCPNECVDIVADRAAICLAGNHDLGVCNKIDADDFSPRAKKALFWTKDRLTGHSRDYLGSLKSTADYKNLLLSHGSPEDPVWGYVFSEMDAFISFSSVIFSLSFFGHTHVPSFFSMPNTGGTPGAPVSALYGEHNLTLETKKSGQRMLINPGSVGFPRDEKTQGSMNNRCSYAQYALFDLESGVWQFKQVQYDVDSTVKLMKQNGLR